MGTDIRLIRLCRKTNNQLTPESYCDENGGDFLATDYFDILNCEKMDLTESFTNIMGIYSQGPAALNDVAVHSYPLYCRESVIERNNGKKNYGDPFEESYRKMPFLSMIQVHITPEILARIKVQPEHENVIEIFMEDIHTALQDYVDKRMTCGMVYRIYQLLSTGDFSVVIRSEKADTSFEISTELRKRAVKISGQPEIGDLVLYKTYTLLTINNCIVDSIQESDYAKDNKFVIRGCFSNKYWGEWEKANSFIQKQWAQHQTEISRLNGRYDFSMQITEKQFIALFPCIWEFKNGKNSRSAIVQDNEVSVSPGNSKVDFLKYLLNQRYLSYINERYLLNPEFFDGAEKTKGCFISQEITEKGVLEKDSFLYDKNRNRYDSVKRLSQKVLERLESINGYRKNLKNYFYLLCRLIDLCQMVNCISDTRIQALALLEQAEVVLESLSYYLDLMASNEDSDILDSIDDYLREAVCAMDAYAQYIRNNNMQSLQTPNYNIESTTSMEKLMIGYSAFVNKFIEFYLESSAAAQAGFLCHKPKQYMPIVISALKDEDLSVELMFPEGVAFDWNREKLIQSEQKRRRHMMVITCPTLQELGDIPNMITLLFHEIAHQFRYESRKDRNDMLFLYVTKEAFEIIAEEVVKRFLQEEKCVDIGKKLVKMFRDGMTKAYIQAMYGISDTVEAVDDWTELMKMVSYEFQDAPLNCFGMRVKEDISQFLWGWERNWEIESRFSEFIRGILLYLDMTDSDIQKGVKAIYDLMGKMVEEDTEQFLEIRKNVKKYADALAMVGVSSVTDKDSGMTMEKALELEDLDHQLSAFFIKENANKEVRVIKDHLYTFAGWLTRLDSYNLNYDRNMLEKKKLFVACAYNELCRSWKGVFQDIRKNSENSPAFKVWEAAGRFFGLDCNIETNRKIFDKCLEINIGCNVGDIAEQIEMSIGYYREETSDLFMNSFVKLSAFGYVNLMAGNIPTDIVINKGNIQRIIHVIVAKWINGSGKAEREQVHNQFQIICQDMMQKLEQYREAVYTKYNLQQLWNGNPVVNGWGSFVDDVAEWRELCLKVLKTETVARMLQPEKDACYKVIKHLGAISKILENIAQMQFDEIEKLYDRKLILDDYCTGVRVLEGLENLEEQNDSLLKRMGSLCKVIARMLNNPESGVLDPECYAELNGLSIEFLCDAYYLNKLNTAQMVCC